MSISIPLALAMSAKIDFNEWMETQLVAYLPSFMPIGLHMLSFGPLKPYLIKGDIIHSKLRRPYSYEEGDSHMGTPPSLQLCDVFVTVTKESFPEILVNNGFFKSRGDARKNGFNIEVPFGTNSFIIGKNKRKITISRQT